MACYSFWLIFLAVVLVDGRPRHHQKRKQAKVEKQISKVARYYQQARADQPLLDAPGDPQNLNVYNIHVQKHGKDNKVSGHMGPHSVSVTMQGPGMVSLDTSQMAVQPGDQKPDHTVTMVKDNGACPECSSVNVKTGLDKPIPLPLTGPSTPVGKPKKQELGHDESIPKLKEITKHQQKPKQKEELQGEEHVPIKHVHEQLEHAPEEKPEAEKKPGAETPIVYLHNHANKILTSLESTVPVIAHKPEHEEQVIKGHKLKIIGEDQPQRVFGKMDSNNAAVVAHGPGTISVTSSGTDLSQNVIFDPSPFPLCPDKQCPRGKREHKEKGHH